MPGLPGGAPHVGEDGHGLTLQQGVITRQRLRVTDIQTRPPDACMLTDELIKTQLSLVVTARLEAG